MWKFIPLDEVRRERIRESLLSLSLFADNYIGRKNTHFYPTKFFCPPPLLEQREVGRTYVKKDLGKRGECVCIDIKKRRSQSESSKNIVNTTRRPKSRGLFVMFSPSPPPKMESITSALCEDCGWV